MTTAIMPPGRLMVQGTRASVRDEAVLVRQAHGFAPCSEVAFLQGLDQATWGSTLLVEAAPVDLARQIIAVSQAGQGDPSRRQRKPRDVARLTDVNGKPHPWWSGRLQLYSRVQITVVFYTYFPSAVGASPKMTKHSVVMIHLRSCWEIRSIYC